MYSQFVFPSIYGKKEKFKRVDMIQKINILFMYFFIRYCPGGPDSDFEYSTQSYTGYEVQITLIDNVPMTLNNYFIISTFDINTRKCK